MRYATPLKPGFTLIELLVAVSITTIMLFLINQIFSEATQASTRGVQTAELIAKHRSLSEQIRRDIANMLGPDPTLGGGSPTAADAGYLVIANLLVDRPGGTPAGVRMPTTGGADAFAYEQLRSDQLLFFRTAAGVEPIAPATVNGYAGSAQVGSDPTDVIRVWYGHVDQAEFDTGTGNWVVGSTLVDDNPATDIDGHRWMLGRQAFFLADDADARGSTVHANDPLIGGSVDGYPSAAVSPQSVFMGLTDVSDSRLSTAMTGTGGRPLIESTAGGTGGFVVTNSGDPAYRAAVYQTIYGDQRLQVLETPRPPYESYQVAMGHPVFAQNVREFEVSFAAAADNSGTLDRDATTDEIIWYDFDNPPTWSGYTRDPSDPSPGLTNADAVFVFRHDYPDNWPYLIRIRYRLHDDRGRVQSTRYDPTAGGGAGADVPITGRWFEVIVPVNRP